MQKNNGIRQWFKKRYDNLSKPARLLCIGYLVTGGGVALGFIFTTLCANPLTYFAFGITFVGIAIVVVAVGWFFADRTT